MKRMLTLFTLASLTLIAGSVAAKPPRSIGSPSGCKQLSGSARAACTKCVGSGSFWQTAEKVCGMTSDMTPLSVKEKGDPWPKPPKSMPPQQKQYVTIQPGKFRIGSIPPGDGSTGRPSEIGSEMTITRPFLMKTTEVTEGEYFFVMKKLPKRYKTGSLDRPAIHVSWLDAIAYLNALSKLEKLEPCYVVSGETVEWKGLDCKGYRLPTEAEWEYAARGGVKAPTYGPMDEIAWYDGNSNLDGTGQNRQPVGGKKPNAYGLNDMLGNVAEWTWDEFQESAFVEPKTDPIIGGLKMTDRYADRTPRGSTFLQSADMSVAYRSINMDPYQSGDTIGFRPVRTVKSK